MERAASTTLFIARAQRALDLPRPIFLSVGRVAVEKNLEALLDLDLPGSTVIVGDGPARRHLERRYRHAHFLGAEQGEACRRLCQRRRFASSSRTDTFRIRDDRGYGQRFPRRRRFLSPGRSMSSLPALACSTRIYRRPASGPDHLARQAREHSMRFTWKESARQFLDNIEASRSDLEGRSQPRLRL